MDIKLKYTTIDHYNEYRSYKSLAGAQRYAREKMGNVFDLGSDYVVSADGVAKIVCEGVTPAQLMGVQE